MLIHMCVEALSRPLSAGGIIRALVVDEYLKQICIDIISLFLRSRVTQKNAMRLSSPALDATKLCTAPEWPS
jgi:hypothetical protein